MCRLLCVRSSGVVVEVLPDGGKLRVRLDMQLREVSLPSRLAALAVVNRPAQPDSVLTPPPLSVITPPPSRYPLPPRIPPTHPPPYHDPPFPLIHPHPTCLTGVNFGQEGCEGRADARVRYPSCNASQYHRGVHIEERCDVRRARLRAHAEFECTEWHPLRGPVRGRQERFRPSRRHYERQCLVRLPRHATTALAPHPPTAAALPRSRATCAAHTPTPPQPGVPRPSPPPSPPLPPPPPSHPPASPPPFLPPPADGYTEWVCACLCALRNQDY